MIRLYFDWNVISELKRNNNDKYKLLKEKITRFRTALIIPFSNYHVEDLIKNNLSSDKIDQFVKKDLAYLEELSQEHFLGLDKDGKILVQIGSPLKFLETIEETNYEELLDFEKIFNSIDDLKIGDSSVELGKSLKSLYELTPAPEHINNSGNPLVTRMFPPIHETKNMWDVMKGFAQFNKNMFLDKSFLKSFRNDVQESSVKMDVNHGNWQPHEVIKNLNQSFKEKGLNTTFTELIESSLENQKNVSRVTYFTTAYLMLDFYGYKSDRLSKPSNSFTNIINDANHSYIGAYCDFVVSDDENFLAKSKALYHEFNIQPNVVSVDEFNNIIDNVVHSPIDNIQEVLNFSLSFLNQDYIIEEKSADNNSSNSYLIFKLPIYFFNYFNYLIYENIGGYMILMFRRVFKNYSDFIYFTDTKQLLKDLFILLGETNDVKTYSDVEKDFVYNEDGQEKQIVWSFDKVHFLLEKEVEERRECLKIIIDNRHNQAESQPS